VITAPSPCGAEEILRGIAHRSDFRVVAVKAALFVGAWVVAVSGCAPTASADPNQFPSLSDFFTVNAADYQTYRAYATSGVQFATPGGYRCRMNFTHKQNGSYMQCWGILPGTPSNHVEVSYLAGADLVTADFSNVDLATMDVIPSGAGVQAKTLTAQDYGLLPTRSRVIYTDGPVQTCGVDAAMTACELIDQGRQHGFVLSPQGSWTF
jgi:hypothetical protein